MFIIDIIKVIILGIVEGITEWLPISSTGHLIIFEKLLPLNSVSENYMTMFRVVIQLGAILAVVLIYFKTLNPFSKNKSEVAKTATWNLWIKIIIASIPAGVLGLLLDDFFDSVFYNPLTISITLILYGLAFIYIEKLNLKAKISSINSLSIYTALLIGFAQVLALIPGTSRSGATILAALILGCARPLAAQFSFFLAIPVMFGASGLKFVKYIFKYNFGFGEFFLLLIGMIVSFIVSLIAIKLLVNYVKKHTFTDFGYYRIALGIVVFIVFLFIKF